MLPQSDADSHPERPSSATLGVVVLSAGREPAFADALACRLLGAASPESLRARWPEIARGPIGAALERMAAGPEADAVAALPPDPDRGAPGCRVEIRRLPSGSSDGYVLIAHAPGEPAPDALRLEASRMSVIARLFGAATHDLFSPINAAVVNVELLRLTFRSAAAEGRSPATDKQERCLATLTEEMMRLSHSIRTLMAFAAPSESRIARRIDPSVVAAAAAEIARPQARKRKGTVQLESPASPLSVVADPDALLHALLLLVLHAFAERLEGGSVVIATSSEAGRVRFDVRSSPPSEEPGDAAAPSDDDDLSIARAIARTLGGEVTFRSVERGGTIRTLSLALDVPPTAPRSPRHP